MLRPPRQTRRNGISNDGQFGMLRIGQADQDARPPPVAVSQTLLFATYGYAGHLVITRDLGLNAL
jgi:hypothetical protein